jgi:hypothetical protein
MNESTPIACTLTAAGFAAQARRWEQLIARAMTGRAETEKGLRLSFRPEPGIEDELRALVAVETECCAWAAWTVKRTAGEVVLDIRSTAEGAATLRHMLAAP